MFVETRRANGSGGDDTTIVTMRQMRVSIIVICAYQRSPIDVRETA